MRSVTPTILLSLFFLFLQNTAEGKQIQVLHYEGTINPVTSKLITAAISESERTDAEALIVQLDTPGGLDPAMRDIVKAMIASEVPVVVYVSPSGGRAASAGAFIAIAAHLAAMAPGTNIGAAHPVLMGGKEVDEIMKAKMENDAAAYIRSLAERRGRNAEWAEAAVRDSASITEKEALQLNVVDFIAEDIPDLVSQIDGRQVRTSKGEVTLETSQVEIIEISTSFRNRILQIISDPNVAYVLMLLGTTGLIAELYSPGAVFPGVVGAICLILAFFAFQTVPINYAGLLLILLGLSLFAAELVVPSFGILGIGATIALLIGSLMLVDADTPDLKISLKVIVPSVLSVALLFAFIFRAALHAQKMPIETGIEKLVGQIAIAQKDLSPRGPVQIQGEIWQAESDDPISAGEEAEVVAVIGMKLRVKKTPKS
ncbi:MAG: nodulation protein NfeD [Nitrospiria bacterium]